MYRWRVSIFNKTARTLGSIVAPDDEALARGKAIEFFHVAPEHQFRVVVTRLEKAKKAAEPAD